MFGSVLSAAIIGMEVCPIQVEADVSDGLPSFTIVGYASSQVKEAQERVKTALRNMGIALPPKRITINLSPVHIRKEGAGFDLPVAAAILCAMGILPQEILNKVMLAGEISLSGRICRISGVLPIVMKAKELGCHTCIVPLENRMEGRLVEEIRIIGIKTIRELVSYRGVWKEQEEEQMKEKYIEKNEMEPDFSEIQGQEHVKRVAEIAVSGFHNLLLIGPPGAGKTMIARRIPTIFPELTSEESLEITRIYSIAGLLSPQLPIMKKRPFRAPHPTVTPQAMAGGGKNPKPGEVTLAHQSVLFLDELPEFSKKTLEVLRQPLEDGHVELTRILGKYIFPANFLLAAAMNKPTLFMIQRASI